MEGSKLLDLLLGFSAKSFRELDEWLQSPIFNKNQDLLDFYQCILPELKKGQAPTKKAVFKKLYPQKNFDERQINYQMSFLLKQAEAYLAYQSYQSQPLREEYYCLRAYADLGLDKHYNYILNQTKRRLKKRRRDADYYYYQYLLAEVENQYFLQQKLRRYDPRLQQASDFLDRFFLASKLRYACEMLDRRQMFAADYQPQLLDEIWSYIESRDWKEEPFIDIYAQILRMLRHPTDEAYFETLQQLLENQAAAFSEEQQREWYTYALNYCVRKINKGQKHFMMPLFELYRYLIEAHLAFEQGKLSPWSYKNMIGLGLRLEQFDYIESFIETYTPFLDEEFQKDALHYNRAELHYYKKEYEQAHEHLLQVELSEDIHYKLGGRRLLLKIYWESEEEEALLALFASFRMFLRRNQLIAQRVREGYLAFIQIVQQLHRGKTADLEQKIKETRDLPERAWLRAKLKEVEGA